MGRGRLPTLVAVLFVLCVAACSAQPAGESGADITAQVIVTKGFGKEVMLKEVVELAPGTSAMEALQQVADVETKYGGGFVDSINGIRSKYPVEQDWFFYVNGISSNRGMADCVLRDGDMVHLDFHDWRFRTFIPAIIGDFPEPFWHGYGGQIHPTVIVYEDGLEDCARDLESSLEMLGVSSIAVHSASDLAESDKQHSNLVLVGTADCKLVQDLNHVWEKLGFFARFEGGDLAAYDSGGGKAAVYGAGSGLIQATQSPWNPDGIGVCENVAWMVSGTDKAGVTSAVDALINGHDEFQHAYAIVVSNGETVRVPH